MEPRIRNLTCAYRLHMWYALEALSITNVVLSLSPQAMGVDLVERATQNRKYGTIEKIGLLHLLPKLSWEPLDSQSMMPRGVGTFSTIENPIVITFIDMCLLSFSLRTICTSVKDAFPMSSSLKRLEVIRSVVLETLNIRTQGR